MNIRFLLFDKKKEKTSLRAFVYYRGKEYRISIGESVLTKFWNENKNRCKLTRDYEDAPHINKRLDKIEDIITNIFNDFGLITPTEKTVREKYKNIINNINIESGGISSNEYEQCLVNFAEKFLNESDRAKTTKKSYQTTINKLKEFESSNRIKLRFIDIDINFYNKFKKWLIGENYSRNYIGTIFKNITTFMNKSGKSDIHNFSGHKHEDFKVEKEDVDTIYLSTDELENIFNLEFTEELLIENGFDNRTQNLKRAIKSLNEERDRFLIGCYTALRHSDYSRIDILNFNDDIVSIWTVKKDKKVYIPIHYRLRQIMERRCNILPPPISEQKHNSRIKQIGKLAGINADVLLTKTRGGKRENITGKKYEFITSHTARRSGATNMYIAGLDIKFIQDILGHSKVEQTLKYIKVSALENAKRLQDHPYFKGEVK